MISRRSTLGLVAAAPFALSAQSLLASTAPVFSDDGPAIRGADAVAFFTENTHRIGSSAYAVQWNGATWHFVSAENRDLFAADPERYAPQYGGYCAFAMSRGYIAPTIPEAWTIYEDRLYLNFDLSIRARWSRDIPGNITAANRHWPGILG